MSLPHGFLEELRQRVSLSAVIGRKVIWDNRKSLPAKGDYWAPCPFHQEKTASFHVDDRKGFYYCFGCHAKGDAISFVKDMENVEFMEAVEILAREAGMQMPARDPQAQKKREERDELAEIMDMAVKYYQLQLRAGGGQAAREYLDQRGLTPQTRERYEIGFTGLSKDGLFQALKTKGFAPDKIEKVGLCYPPRDGMGAADRFRNRIMFPIRDASGRCIAFGGRAMDPADKAKYINSSDTPLFDKSRTLYNHGPAREAAGKTGTVIVTEGYMDVIALGQAGFDHALAPMGTAVTEDQLRMIWRFCPEPVMALDGDKAGQRAAERAADLALPLLEAGKSLRFVILPEGKDPDDVLRTDGADAMRAILEGARPMIDVLWDRETRDRNLDSPERRAALDADLRKLLGRIKDPSIRRHYTDAFAQKRKDLFRPKFTPRGDWKKRNHHPEPTYGTRQSLLVRGEHASEDRIRESAILYGCMLHPEIAAQFEAELERTPFVCSDLERMRNALLMFLSDALDAEIPDQSNTLISAMTDQLGFDPKGRLEEIGQVRIAVHYRANAAPSMVTRALRNDLQRQRAIVGVASEVREAEHDLEAEADEGTTWRLQQANVARDRAARDALHSDGEGIDEESLSKLLKSFVENEIWVKKKR